MQKKPWLKWAVGLPHEGPPICNIILLMPLKEYVLADGTKKSNKFVGILGNVNTVVAVSREK